MTACRTKIWKYGKQFTYYNVEEYKIKCTNQLSNFAGEMRGKKSPRKIRRCGKAYVTFRDFRVLENDNNIY